MSPLRSGMGPSGSRMSFLGPGQIQSTESAGLSWAPSDMKRVPSGLTWALVPVLGPFSPKLKTRCEMDYFRPSMHWRSHAWLQGFLRPPLSQWRIYGEGGGDIVTCSPLDERNLRGGGGRACSKEFWLGGGGRRFPRGDLLSQTQVIFILSRKIRIFTLWIKLQCF